MDVYGCVFWWEFRACHLEEIDIEGSGRHEIVVLCVVCFGDLFELEMAGCLWDGVRKDFGGDEAGLGNRQG